MTMIKYTLHRSLAGNRNKHRYQGLGYFVLIAIPLAILVFVHLVTRRVDVENFQPPEMLSNPKTKVLSIPRGLAKHDTEWQTCQSSITPHNITPFAVEHALNTERIEEDLCTSANISDGMDCGNEPFFSITTNPDSGEVCEDVLADPIFPATPKLGYCGLLNYTREIFSTCVPHWKYKKKIIFLGDSRIRNKFVQFCLFFGSETIYGTKNMSAAKDPRVIADMCCDSNVLEIKFLWTPFVDPAPVTKVLRQNPGSVIVISNCIWEVLRIQGRSPENYKEDFQRSLAREFTSIKSLPELREYKSPIIFLDHALVTHQKRGGMFAKYGECAEICNQELYKLDKSPHNNIHIMYGQRSVYHRYGTFDGLHSLTEGNQWSVLRIVNSLCNNILSSIIL